MGVLRADIVKLLFSEVEVGIEMTADPGPVEWRVDTVPFPDDMQLEEVKQLFSEIEVGMNTRGVEQTVGMTECSSNDLWFEEDTATLLVVAVLNDDVTVTIGMV